MHVNCVANKPTESYVTVMIQLPLMPLVSLVGNLDIGYKYFTKVNSLISVHFESKS